MSLTVTLPSEIETSPSAEICPVCGAFDFISIYSEARDPITFDPFRVVECSACGTAYTIPRPATLDRYYPRQYRAYGALVVRILSTLYALRVSGWTRLKPEGGSVLEVGCGPGLMLAAFRRRGWRVFGIERNEAAAETARQTLGPNTIATSMEGLPADARFDLIVLFQVLEHIAEPAALLRECTRKMAPGGLLIANVPNFSSWQSRFAGPKWMHLDVPRHLVHYTPETIAKTLKSAGLTLSALSFTSLEHDPYGWVESTISLLTGRTNSLTRSLMGLDKFSPRVLFSWVLAALLLPPALLLATVSWLAGSGALMEAIAVISCAGAKQSQTACWQQVPKLDGEANQP
jgi:2-polyprenyl-3-methyl-5-hydroxy-6-metoxy-1,4-benzoquinol methylase